MDKPQQKRPPVGGKREPAKKPGAPAPAQPPPPKPDYSNPAEALVAGRIRRTLDEFPAVKVPSSVPSSIPEVKAPSLEGIEVYAPLPRKASEEEVDARMALLARAAAPFRERRSGDTVAAGDSVQLDIVGYAQGTLLPFSIRSDVWMDVAPDPMLPGFTEALVGLKVGLAAAVIIYLPKAYPVEHLRGVQARFLIEVKAAREVKDPKDEAGRLKLLNRGKTMKEARAAIRREIEEELQEQAVQEARERALDQLAARTEANLPDSLIDDEIQRQWAKVEGVLVGRLAFDAAQQREALQIWLTDPATRIQAIRRLRVSLALEAIAQKEHIEASRESLDQLLEPIARGLHMSSAELRDAFRKQPPRAAFVEERVRHLLALEHVLGKVKFHFGEAGPK